MEICSDTPVPQLSITQVYNTLRKIKQTATGPDCLPFWVWKENAAILTPAVHALWNLSPSTQTWPAAWKEANVNPLPKVDIPTQREDFRGISVTSVIARAFEQVVYTTFSKQDVENYLNNNQFAYRSGGSCTNALLKMQHIIYQALDSPETQAVRLFTMDFSKAFDRVKHNLLVEKVKQCPLNPYIVNWLISFLSDRKQRVVCNNTVCEWKYVNRGTTQGSVNGPYLFSLFLDDLDINNNDDTALIKYADDTSIIVTVRKDAPDESLKTLELFLNWTADNEMSCNATKCKELCLTKKSVQAALFPEICGIEQVNELRMLGLTLQQSLRYTKHVKVKLYEANQCLYILRALLKEGYTQDAIDHLFKAIILPKFMYALPVYGASSSDVNLVQRFLARCYKRRYISECIDINEILEKIDRKLFKKIKENVTSPLHDMLPVTKESSRRLRRQTPLLPRVHTERFKNCFFNRIIFKYKLSI